MTDPPAELSALVARWREPNLSPTSRAVIARRICEILYPVPTEEPTQ